MYNPLQLIEILPPQVRDWFSARSILLLLASFSFVYLLGLYWSFLSTIKSIKQVLCALWIVSRINMSILAVSRVGVRSLA
jgi:hypothetical protein